MRVNITFIMKTGIGLLAFLTVFLLLSKQGALAKRTKKSKNVEKKQAPETPQTGGGQQINLNLNDLSEEGMAAAVKKITDQIKQLGVGGTPTQEPEPEKEVKKEGKKGKIKKPKKESVAGSTTKSKKKAKKQEDKVETKAEKKEKDVIPEEKKQEKEVQKEEKKQETINLSVVACGDRLEETTVMLKSAVLLTNAPLHFHIFTEPDLRNKFLEKLGSWPEDVRKKFDVTIHMINFPVADAATWKKLFKLCACQRLFLPLTLTSTEAVLYVDTDVLFLRPLEDVWNHFRQFNSSQIAGLTPEHEVPSAGWYNRFARHPFYGKLGVNSGVMLMNLTRMRKVGWTQHITHLYKEFTHKITWGDQDLINIFFHYQPDKLYVFDCSWNYRPDHCKYVSNCKSAEAHGVSILHGNREVFHNTKNQLFKIIYEAIKQIDFHADLKKDLLEPLQKSLEQANNSRCYKAKEFLTKQLQWQLEKKENQ